MNKTEYKIIIKKNAYLIINNFANRKNYKVLEKIKVKGFEIEKITLKIKPDVCFQKDLLYLNYLGWLRLNKQKIQ